MNHAEDTNIHVAPTDPPRPVREESIMNIMRIAPCDRDEASRALYRNNHDVYDAHGVLNDGRLLSPRRPRGPRPIPFWPVSPSESSFSGPPICKHEGYSYVDECWSSCEASYVERNMQRTTE